MPLWIYAALGGAATLALLSLIVLIRSLGGSGSNPADADRLAASRAELQPVPAAVVTGGASLTTAQIVARCEPSVALVKGKASSGTGFLIRRGVVATNAHVIDDEFLSNLEIRFPSAAAGRQGPNRAELLYEDPNRDLAFLSVDSGLPALDVAASYRFVKGEEITVIGNPGLGDDVVLENAISRGVISSKTVLDGMNYLQLSIAINPGNSGGPVFDSAGRVIGVATLKSTKAEALAFCIPIEEVQTALGQLDSQPRSARAARVSRHRAQVALQLLAVGGVLYSIGLEVRAGTVRARVGAGQAIVAPSEETQKLHEVLTQLDQKLLSTVDEQIPHLQADPALTVSARRNYPDLAANYRAMRDLYANPNQPANFYATRVHDLKAQHLRLVKNLGDELKIEVPPKLLAVLESRPTTTGPPVFVTEIVPAPLHPRLRARPGPFPRGPIGPGSPPVGFNPAADAQARMQEMRDRMQQQMRDMQNRARGFRPRFGR